jgi:hypothetical protein
MCRRNDDFRPESSNFAMGKSHDPGRRIFPIGDDEERFHNCTDLSLEAVKKQSSTGLMDNDVSRSL